MIPLFVIAAAASYLLARAICLKASSNPKASSDGESQDSSWMCLTFGVILLLISIGILAWSWYYKIAVYGWLDFDVILTSPELAILVLGILTGTLVAYWHTKVLPIYPFHINTKLHMIWLWIIGSLVALGIALPLLSFIFQEMGLRSLQTPAFSVETSQSIGRSPLQFKVERQKLVHTKSFSLSSPSPTLKNDIVYLEKKEANEEKQLFENAKKLSDNYLEPFTKCARFAFFERQLDSTQILPHILPVGYALQRLLIKDNNNAALQEDVKLVKDRVVNGRKRLLELMGPGLDNDKCPKVNPNIQKINAAGLSKVPPLYVFIANVYITGDDLEAALAVLEEGNSKSDLFRNDMNYNRTRGWILYALQRPLSESIKFHERAFDFADRVIETVTVKNKEDRDFAKRYAKAQRLLRQELAFLLAQAGRRKGDALAYARAYFEEVNGRKNGLPRFKSSIAIGRVQDWQKSEIYELVDDVNSYDVYGYVLMAFGAREVEPNIKALHTARQLFREGLEVFDDKKVKLDRDIGKYSTNWLRISLENYLEHAEFLIRKTTRRG